MSSNGRKGIGGPKTPEGKLASIGNATKHGLRGRTVVLASESADDYADHCAGVLASLAPRGTLETEVCERIAELTWRLRRAARFEAHASTTWLATKPRWSEAYSVRSPPLPPFGMVRWQQARSLERPRRTRVFCARVANGATVRSMAEPTLREVLQAVQAIQNELREVKADVGTLKADIARLDAKVDTMDAKVEGVRAELRTVEAKVDAHRAETAKGFADVERELAGHADPIHRQLEGLVLSMHGALVKAKVPGIPAKVPTAFTASAPRKVSVKKRTVARAGKR